MVKGWHPSNVVAPVELRQALKVMLGQMKHERLEVGLAVAPEGQHTNHKVRTVQNQNPWWYRELCSRHTKNRTSRYKRYGKQHHDTKIHRNRIVQALTILSSGKMAQSLYANELLAFAREQIELWKQEEEEYGEQSEATTSDE